MDPLHIILVVLLGLLVPSMAAVPRQMAGGHIGNTDMDYNGDHTSDKGLTGRQSVVPRGLEGMLIEYEIQCDSDPDTTEPPPGFKQGKVLSNKFCRDWWECNSDGKKKQKMEVPKEWKPKGQSSAKGNVKWCKDHCKCVVVDKPVEHASWNYGCVDPYGAYMQGSYGSVARDIDLTGPPLSDDGLAMEAFDGPPRKG
ncbi:hypothetical protein INS49_014057 [Diaporthe citri]|uniref:uncharacterized protein n=1 Tax=Diaporthe citri TaxID=83186 RepID=UPI001C7F7EA4|nr:uncharacterized protein INS49_014057 [Diaporthe citri]KAG6358173.1 hypothetical protein INS49_014057 [Diaporthe citri]